jgi:hypothetical protein
MRRTTWLLALGLVPVLAACSSQPDSKTQASTDAGSGNSGQAGADNAGAAGTVGGEASEAGEAGAGGEAGATACDPSSCDDGDPCTLDSCDNTAAGHCAHAFTAGLGLEKDFPPIAADTQYRVTLTAGSDAFYFSTFSRTGEQNEVEILRLGEDDDAYSSLKKLSSYPAFAGGLLSAAGLAMDNSAALGESLHALVAVQAAGGGAQVWQLTTGSDQALSAPQKVGDSYASASVANYPVERALAGIVHGAWINADGSISVLSPGGGAPAAFGSSSTPAGTLALIGTDEDKPAVVFSGETKNIWLQTIGHDPVPVLECQSVEGGFSSMSATPLPEHDGTWLASWSKHAPNVVTTESHLLLCSNGTCIPDTSTVCADSDSNNRRRNGASEGVHLQGDPPGQSYFVSVGPSLSDAGSGAATAFVVASLTQLVSPLDEASTSTAIGPPLTLASQPAVGPDFRGPDFPAVAILPGPVVKVAIAWVAPSRLGASSSPDELHLQRYRMCLPKQ